MPQRSGCSLRMSFLCVAVREMPIPPGAVSRQACCKARHHLPPAQPAGVTCAKRRAAAAHSDPALSMPRLRVMHTTRSTTTTLRSCSRCCLGRRPPLRARAAAAYWAPVVHPMRSVCCCAQGGRDEGQSPARPVICAYDTNECLPTTRRCRHPGCSLLVCDPCAQKMCPDGENESEYHWCARHMPTEEEDAEGDSDSDPFAYRPAGRPSL